MLVHPQFDPVIFQVGPLAVRWYGTMYLCAFAAFWWLGKLRASRDDSFVKPEYVGDILFYGVLGVIIGGRIGSVFFYNLDQFLQNPFYLFQIWQGGMSFHGGLLGVVIALWLYQRKHGWGFLRFCDFIAPLVPLGLGFGRIGNFINAELWGRPTDVAWGMVFPNVDELARHPSQLYQAALEGLVLFVIIWVYSKSTRPIGSTAALFVMLYGVFRFITEFFREPDGHIGFIAFDWLTMGQLLSVPMILLGLIVFLLAYQGKFATKQI